MACKSKNSSDGNEKTDKSVDQGLQKSVERGPIKITVSTDKSRINIAERINLTIDIYVEENYEVELPKIGEKLDQFGIVDYHTSSPQLISKDKKRMTRTYILEPILSGNYLIPPMTFGFWKKGDRETDPHTIETESLSITVTSLLPADMADLKINDIHPPLSLPSSNKIWIILGISAASIIFIGSIAGFLIYNKRKQQGSIMAMQIPAHEIAYQALEHLIAQKFAEKGEIKLFYQEISNILRQYIENRFGLRAPEQTTEEFLTGLQTEDSLPAPRKLLLDRFLKYCDLVKFAEHKPQTQDIQNTFDSCKLFIEETKNQV